MHRDEIVAMVGGMFTFFRVRLWDCQNKLATVFTTKLFHGQKFNKPLQSFFK
jgi:hypothetical protein